MAITICENKETLKMPMTASFTEDNLPHIIGNGQIMMNYIFMFHKQISVK